MENNINFKKNYKWYSIIKIIILLKNKRWKKSFYNKIYNLTISFKNNE